MRLRMGRVYPAMFLTFVSFCVIRGAFAAVNLSPKAIVVTENRSLALNCSYSGNKTVVSPMLWTKSGENSTSTISWSNNCDKTGFLENDQFVILCDKTWTSVKMESVDRKQNNVKWQCSVPETREYSNFSQVFVSVPVISAEITSNAGKIISIEENKTISLRCSTSISRPTPTVLWFLKNNVLDTNRDISNEASQTPAGDANTLAGVNSTLHYSFNRTYNGYDVYCVATNIKGQNATSSLKHLSIIFPPTLSNSENGSTYRFFEHNQGILSCTAYGGNPLANLTWNCFSDKVSSNVCDTTVTSTVSWEVFRGQDNQSCVCFSDHKMQKSWISVNIGVLYPPEAPIFKIGNKTVEDVIRIILNNSLVIKCETESNPDSWYKWNMGKTDQTLIVANADKQNAGEYICSVNNTMIDTDGKKQFGTNNSSIELDVLYPPKRPSFTYSDNKTYISNSIVGNKLDVVNGDVFSISCRSIGNPDPNYVWDDENVNSVIVINAALSMNKTCTAKNLMVETVGETRYASVNASIAIRVYYPPNIPKIKMSNGKDEEIPARSIVHVIENETVILSCFSESKPDPKYIWRVNITHELQGQNVFKFESICRHDVGTYTCHVNNLMNRTFGAAEAGKNSSSTYLNVLYPPEVGSLTNISLNEESKLNITCPVVHGNPINTTVIWTRKTDSRLWSDSHLIILNVSRSDDTTYTCTVFNEMVPTIGNATKIKKSGEFHLNIFFSAAISNFSVLGRIYNKATMVNKSEEVSLSCTAEANPASNITIRSPKHELIASAFNTNTLRYTLLNVSYYNAGQYLCNSWNNYTKGVPSNSELILIVRCPPRPSSDSYSDGTVTTTLSAKAVMQFTAHGFLDEPDKTVFTWFKANASIDNNNRKFAISSFGLQSNLTIRNVTETDFGQYRLRVTNSNGDYLHIYKLQAKDKPDAPKDFTYIVDSISDTSVTVKWVPGFHGGYPQTFILLYKRMKETNWQNKSIRDSGSRHMNYTLFGLFSETEYQVQMFARNEEGDSAYTDRLQFSTRTLKTEPVESKTSEMVRIVAGSVSSVIIITVAGMILGVFVYRRRNVKETGKVYQNVPFSGKQLNTAATSKRNQTTTKKRKPEIVQIEETTFEGLQDVDDVPILTNERTEYCNAPDIIEKLERIQVSELFWYVSEKSEDMFEADYQKLPTELQKPCTCARKPENIALNRYNGIYPYDHSRVTLDGHPDFFINACYIDGYKNSKKYIASLGPTAKTTRHFETFWLMIWYERSDIIVMLTNLREPSGMKCEQYWPKEGKTEQYGDVCVSSQTTEVFAEYTITTFSVSCDEERRSLTHLHYTAWPDKTVPEDVTSLIEFRQRMKITPTSSEGPIVVHCSAGIGRTGTLIALDRLIEEGQDKGSVDVFECVNNMREQRVKMVQTHEQYIYIHKALVNALTFDCEALPVETFNEYVDTTNNNMYSRLFQQLRQTVEKDSKAEADDRVKNESLTDKNRQGADIPGRKCRVLLYLDRRGEGSEYINAVYINSFKKKDYFISTQSPLTSTVTDFTAMIYQENCSCIVTMENLKEPVMKVGKYLPDGNHTLTLGNFMVSCSVLETKHHYVVRKMKIKYAGQFESGEKSIYHFQYTKWLPGHDTPANAEEFVQFVHEVEEYASELGEERSHVVVHCLKANERSGLFCAVAILMEKIKFEGQVSVSNTLRHLRTRRRTAIISMEQIKFCYLAASAYIKKYLK